MKNISPRKPLVKITQKDLLLVIESAERMARRMGMRFVVDWERIIIVPERQRGEA